jgi:hypothetical protein
MQLRVWRRMVEVARSRVVTGRLVEIRYEDLVANPFDALTPLFSRIGAQYSRACEDPLKESWVGSKSLPPLPQMPIRDLLTDAGLLNVLGEFGYEFVAGEGTVGPARAKKHWAAGDGLATAVPKGVRDTGTLLVMEPDDMSPEQGQAFCYWAPLLVGDGDTPDQPERSTFMLLEDGEVIGTPHTLHSDIREKGHGLWSHWGQNIFFSSSDGTDPRQNGREYAVMKPQHDLAPRGGDS